jgi:putative uncharacterized protein VV1850
MGASRKTRQKKSRHRHFNGIIMKIKKQTLSELESAMRMLSKEEQSQFMGGDRVVVDVTRSYFGSQSTGSSYVATAYNNNGNVVSVITGYFLEPRYDPSLSRTAGSDTAIPDGRYNVSPSSYHGRSGYYEIDHVPGRSGIKIHSGVNGSDTTGCLLPGSGIVQVGGEYTVSGSPDERKELFGMFKKYGGGGIIMNIHAKRNR